jgi:hypothetical protein
MRLLSIIRHRLRSLFTRATVDQELDEELRYHLQRQMEEDIAVGMPPDRARQAAHRAFAGFEQRKEECRDMRGLNLLDDLLQDLRFAQRQLWKSPGFTATAILVLALGLCASVAIFAFVDAALIKPLPYPDASRLVGVYESTKQCPTCNLSYQDYLDWRKLNKVFQSLEAYDGTGLILTTPSGAQPAHAARVSAGFFHALGVTPPLGRDFRPGEDLSGASRTAILSYATWQNRYGAKPAVLGQAVVLDSLPYVVVGVLPRDFHFAPQGAADGSLSILPASAKCGVAVTTFTVSPVSRMASPSRLRPPIPPSSPPNSKSSIPIPIAAKAPKSCLSLRSLSARFVRF